MPQGVEVAGLAPRLLAAVLDAVLPAIVAIVLAFFAWPMEGTRPVVLAIIGAVVLGAYCVAQWWAYATRGAGLGFRIMGLRLAGVKDGRPIGWWRMFIRFIVKLGLCVTVIGGVLLIIFLVINDRRQGWHDLAADSIAVDHQPHEPGRPAASSAHIARGQSASTVGLPPHLQTAADGRRAERSQPDHFAPPPGPSGAPIGQSPTGQSRRPPQQHLQAQQSPHPWPQGRPHEQVPWQQHPPQRQTPAHPAAAPPPAEQPRPAQHPAEATNWAAATTVTPASAGVPISSVPGFSHRPMPAATPAKAEVPTPEPDGDAEHTRLVTSGGNAGRQRADQDWYVRLDDGREVELTRVVLIGRSPTARLDETDVELVQALGDSRMVSKTHLAIGVDARGAYLIDRGSTNGTAIVNAQGELDPCASGVQVRVREGNVVSFGNRWLTVLRRPPAA